MYHLNSSSIPLGFSTLSDKLKEHNLRHFIWRPTRTWQFYRHGWMFEGGGIDVDPLCSLGEDKKMVAHLTCFWNVSMSNCGAPCIIEMVHFKMLAQRFPAFSMVGLGIFLAKEGEKTLEHSFEWNCSLGSTCSTKEERLNLSRSLY